MRINLSRAALGQLRHAELELNPGRYVVLSGERDALRDLVAVLAGREPPRTGSVTHDGESAFGGPALRRQIAALFADEALPPAKTVLASLAKALEARGHRGGGAAPLLQSAGLQQLENLPPASLGPRETRSVALALALAHDSAELFALHEPLATSLKPSFVLERLDQHTTRGALVLTTTTSPADATSLGGAWLSIELGQLRGSPGGAPRLGAGPWQRVVVETSDARALSGLLHESPLGLTTKLGTGPNSLEITGPALDVTVQEVIRLARAHQLEISRIEAAVPPVEALLAARAGFARGAYEASRAAALGSPLAPHSRPPAAHGGAP